MKVGTNLADQAITNTSISAVADGVKALMKPGFRRGWEIDYSPNYITWNYGSNDNEYSHIGWFILPDTEEKMPMLSFELYQKLLVTMGMPGPYNLQYHSDALIAQSIGNKFDAHYYRIRAARHLMYAK